MTTLKLVCLFLFVTAVNCFYTNENIKDYHGAVDNCVSELNIPLDQANAYRDVRRPRTQNQSDVLCCTLKKIKWVANGKFVMDEVKKLIDNGFKIHADKKRRQQELTTIDVCSKIVQSETDECKLAGTLSTCINNENIRYDLPFLKELCVTQLNITMEKFNSYNLEGELETKDEKCALACLWRHMKLINKGNFSTEVAYRRMRLAVPNNLTIRKYLMNAIDVCARNVKTEADDCKIAGIVGPCFFKKLNELQAMYPNATEDEITDETSTQRQLSKRHVSPKFQHNIFNRLIENFF